MIGYAYNHTRDTYMLYNPEIKRVIMTRNVKWEEWKMIYPEETLNVLYNYHEEYLVPYI